MPFIFSRSTLLVRLRAPGVQFSPGDHVLLYPSNNEDLVTKLLDKLPADSPPSDQLIHIEVARKGKDIIDTLNHSCELRKLLQINVKGE